MGRLRHNLLIGLCLALAMLVAGVMGQSPFPRGTSWLSDRFGGNENDLGGSLVRTEGSGVIDEDLVRTAREVVSHSMRAPMWANPKRFETDVITFDRATFKVSPTLAAGYGRGG